MAAVALAEARRPLVIAGAGACRSQADDALRELCGNYQIPVAGNGLGRGVVAEDNERAFSWPYAQIEAHRADVVLLAGARFEATIELGLATPLRCGRDIYSDRPSGGGVPSQSPRSTCRYTADVAASIRAIGQKLSALPPPDPDRGEWLRAALERRAARLAELQALDTDPMHPAAACRVIAECMPGDVALVGDGADVQNWLYGAVRIQSAPGFFDHYPLGSMGIGNAACGGCCRRVPRVVARRRDNSSRRAGHGRRIYRFLSRGAGCGRCGRTCRSR